MKVKTVKHRAVYAGILLSIIFVFISHSQQDDFPVLKGPNLGQEPPGITPEIFAPGIISTENFGEAGGAFAKNGSIFLFNRRTPPESHKTIYYTELKKGVWARPAPVPFNSKFGDGLLILDRMAKHCTFLPNVLLVKDQTTLTTYG